MSVKADGCIRSRHPSIIGVARRNRARTEPKCGLRVEYLEIDSIASHSLGLPVYVAVSQATPFLRFARNDKVLGNFIWANALPVIPAAREPPWRDADPAAAIDRLRRAGLEVDPIPLHSRLTIDKWNIPVIAARVRSLVQSK